VKARRFDAGVRYGVSVRVERLERRRMMSAGDLDTSFGSSGHVVVDFAGADDKAPAIAMTGDGRIVIAGKSDGHMALARLNSDGSLDKDFGNAGKLITQFTADVNTLAVDQKTGRIYVCGLGTIYAFTRSGVADKTFAGDGQLQVPVPFTFPSKNQLAVESDGRLVYARVEALKDRTAVSVQRYNSDGSLDKSFGDTGGIILQPTSLNLDLLDGLRVTRNGTIYVEATGGDINLPGSNITDSVIYRILSNGSIDTSFGRRGVRWLVGSPIDFQVGDQDEITTLNSISSSGWTITIGDIPPETDVFRYSAGGQLLSHTYANVYFTNQLLLQPDDKLIVLGTSGSTSQPWYGARYSSTGVLDSSYSTKQWDVPAASVLGAVLQTNGQLILAGTRQDANEKGDWELMRLQRGPIDPGTIDLNSNGTLTIKGTELGETIGLTIREKDGRLVARVREVYKSFAPSSVKRIAIDSKQGNDTITIGPGVRGAYVDAGDGDDTVNGGDGGDVIIGGWGSDKLYGNGGDDKLIGGVGNDYLLGGAGNDSIFGNGGVDVVSGAGGNDRLFGGAEADVVHGGAGKDLSESDPLDRRDGVEVLG